MRRYVLAGTACIDDSEQYAVHNITGPPIGQLSLAIYFWERAKSAGDGHSHWYGRYG